MAMQVFTQLKIVLDEDPVTGKRVKTRVYQWIYTSNALNIAQ